MKKSSTLLYIVATFSLLSWCSDAHAQKVTRTKDVLNGEKFSWYVMEPQGTVAGVLMLLPGWGEDGPGIFKKTILPSLLADRGYLTIIVNLRRTLFIDTAMVRQLDHVYTRVSLQYKLVQPRLVLGGLSAGGAVALGYAEHLESRGGASPVKGVFAIDPPLDGKRLYLSAIRKMNYDCGPLIHREGSYIKALLENTAGGTPNTHPEQYISISPFSADAPDGGNARFLKNIPVRLYCEPDIGFVQKKYCLNAVFDDINAADVEALASRLRLLGNTNAHYIATEGKGFHSWNILDAKECANWIMELP